MKWQHHRTEQVLMEWLRKIQNVIPRKMTKSDVTDHVLDCVALVKVVHNDAHSSLIFAQNLDAAVLNFVVINDECFYFH